MDFSFLFLLVDMEDESVVETLPALATFPSITASCLERKREDYTMTGCGTRKRCHIYSMAAILSSVEISPEEAAMKREEAVNPRNNDYSR